MNSLPHHAQNSEAPLAAPCAEQEINIIAVASLGCQRAAYWARRGQAHQCWLGAGGFEQETLPPAAPRFELRTMPDDPELERFYASSLRVIARAKAVAQGTVLPHPRANGF